MNEKVSLWVKKAIEDFKTAEHEMNLPESETVTSSVCFHSQQFVEKMLKAFLTSRGTDFGKTHNIEYLLKLCSETDKNFEKVDLPDLTIYAVEVRYPDEFYTPSFREAKECFEAISRFGKFIFEKLGIRQGNL